ncbi:MAG: hypothetical protein IJ828_08925 [Treponema sp.]|nr:hypothetical protein [Treponema sp.]
MNYEEKKNLIEKMLMHYGEIFSPESAESFVNELSPLLQPNSKYRRPIKEWMNGKTEIIDITLPCLDNISSWSLVQIAQKLDQNTPNIPVAAFLLSLYEEFPITLSEILSVCEEFCWCDESIICADKPECSFAYLDEEYEQWFFLNDSSSTDNLKSHQLWQVLLQMSIFAPIIMLEHELGTTVELYDDGKYYIIPPESENT